MPRFSIIDYITIDDHSGLPVRLANTFDPALPDPELLATMDDLKRFLNDASLPGVPLSSDDVTAVRQVRDAVRDIFLTQSPEQACDQLDQLLTGAAAERRVVISEGSPRFILLARIMPDIAQTIRSVAALALASMVEQFGWDRLRVSQADPCRDTFVDTSNRGAQRFCGPRCASRTHVSAFRHRQTTRANGTPRIGDRPKADDRMSADARGHRLRNDFQQVDDGRPLTIPFGPSANKKNGWKASSPLSEQSNRKAAVGERAQAFPKTEMDRNRQWSFSSESDWQCFK